MDYTLLIVVLLVVSSEIINQFIDIQLILTNLNVICKLMTLQLDQFQINVVQRCEIFVTLDWERQTNVWYNNLTLVNACTYGKVLVLVYLWRVVRILDQMQLIVSFWFYGTGKVMRQCQVTRAYFEIECLFVLLWGDARGRQMSWSLFSKILSHSMID